MKQRVPSRRWPSPQQPGHRPRLLIEDGHPALAVSDFALFRQAGFDVAFCSGPGDDPAACPVMHGQPCPLLAGADVVLHGLDPSLGIAAGIRRQYPDLPVVVEQDRADAESGAEVPEGCVPLRYPCSVGGQVTTLLRAVQDARREARG